MELLVAAGAALTTTGFLFGVEATKAAIADRKDEEEPEPAPDNESPSNKVVLSSARDNAEKPSISPEVSTFRPRRYGSTEVSPGRALLISAFGMTENTTDAAEKKFKANEDSDAEVAMPSSPEWSKEELVALDEREPSGGYWIGSQHASNDVIISTPRNDGSMRFHEFR